MKTVIVSNQEELNECFDIRIKVFVEEQNVPADLELDEYDESPAACRHLLLRDGEQGVGTGRWKFYDEQGTAKLQRVAVRKEYRGTGAGKMIILAMEKDAKEHGAKSSILDGQCQAEGFYRKLGYEVISEEPFLDAGILHVRMKKLL